MKLCPCCKRPLPPLIDVDLTPLQRRIVNLLSEHPGGLYSQQLVDQIYTTADGGPESPKSSIRVIVYHLNKQLKPLGYRVHAGSGGRKPYHLQAI